MNIQTEAVSSLEGNVAVPVVIPGSRLFYWSVRRELWENRSLYLAPLAVAALFLAAFLIGHNPHAHVHIGLSSDSMQQQGWHVSVQPYTIVALVLMGTTFLVALFYCLEALHGERRDRSILFWKSLPVSDTTTVLAKASIPILILPLITFAIVLVTQCIMLLLSSAVMLARGQNVADLWSHLPLWQMSLMLFFHMLAIHGLWYAPFYGWWLLVSAWARRAPLLWAVLPPAVVAVVEKIAFNTSHFAALIGYRFGGSPEKVPFTAGPMSMGVLTAPDVVRYFADPSLWTGLALTAVFLAAAIRLRRYREPM
jgi:ABC-2 type transport system permease protein